VIATLPRSVVVSTARMRTAFGIARER
jgi:hypothetical protein